MPSGVAMTYDGRAPNPATEPMPLRSLSTVREGHANWRGLYTLWWIEIGRPLRSPVTWFVAPALTTLLYFAVLAIAAPEDLGRVAGVPFLSFVAPALAMMAIAQNAFEMTAWSLIDRKISGTIVDALMPPVSTTELLAAFVGAGIARGLILGAVILAAFAPFVELRASGALLALVHAVLAAILLSLIGILSGVWARKYDHVATIENFVVVPLAFLSGSFYDARTLPEPWATLSLANPLTYTVGGFRHALTGAEEGPTEIGLGVLVAASLVLGAVCHRVLARSPKLKP